MPSPKDTILSNYQLPRNDKAEKAVLGAVLFNPENLVAIKELISSEDFYSTGNKIIFSAMCDFADNNPNVNLDLLTLTDFLRSKKQLDLVGGERYLAELTDVIINTGAITKYCEMIKASSRRRYVVTSSLGFIESAMDESENIEETLNDIEQKLSGIAHTNKAAPIQSVKEVVAKVLEQISEKMHGAENPNIKTGIEKLDKMTNEGFEAKQFVVIGARPSVGKTSFVISMIKNMIFSKKPNGESPRVALFSLEMGAAQIMERLISAYTKIPLQKIRAGHFNNSKNDVSFTSLLNAAGVLSSKSENLTIIDEPNMKLADIKSIARSLKRRYNNDGLDAIVIDYIGLIEAGISTRNDARHEQVSYISRQLKILARELDIPVIALSQLSRDVDASSGKEISLSSIRDSGSIEQDADIVIFLQRIMGKDQKQITHQNESGDSLKMISVIVAKQRNGETGKFSLGFKAECASFENVDRNFDEYV